MKKLLCVLLGHKLGHDYRGKPTCLRDCGVRFKYATATEHAHARRFGIR